jgi:hypothetical protein
MTEGPAMPKSSQFSRDDAFKEDMTPKASPSLAQELDRFLA